VRSDRRRGLDRGRLDVVGAAGFGSGAEEASDVSRRVIGWASVALSAAGASLWTWIGVRQNFLEGWYLPRLEQNVGLMLAQYLLPACVIGFLGLVALAFPLTGGALYLFAGAFAISQTRGPGSRTVIWTLAVPLVLLGFGYAWGRPAPRRRAAALLVLFPAATLLSFSVGPALRVAGRRDDGNRGARAVRGNGVELVWAPDGPGWPREGVSWAEAVRRSRYLTADGRGLAAEPVDAWRLPTVEEAVRSQQRGGAPSGGRWDAGSGSASYDRRPEKESPLWDVYSPVIGWWTATEAGSGRAMAIFYDGSVRPLRKRTRRVFLGFRAVRRAPEPVSPDAAPAAR
jgi:hypothetical protein